jgi:putative sterol carrier protein
VTSDTQDGLPAAVRAVLDGLDGPDTLTGQVQVDITGSADGDVSVHAGFDGGHLTEAGPGPAEDPGATLTLTAADAADVLAGSLDPSVAFMQGRMKVTGDMSLVIDLLALAATDDAATRRQRIAALSPK